MKVELEPFIALHVNPIDQCWPNINVRFYKRNVENGRLDAESFFLAHSLVEVMVKEYERIQKEKDSEVEK